MKRLLTILPFALLTLACGGEAPDTPSTPESAPPAGGAIVDPEPEPVQGDADEILVVFLGDSLTAGFGLDEDQAFPYLVEQALKEEGRPVRVVNGGISGDTTAGGLARLDWLLQQRPDIVVVSLGANDGLRGLELGASEENLRQTVQRSLDSGAKVLLSGMLIPPNYGPEYTDAFAEIYPRVARDLGVPLIPFLLDGVAGDAALNQADGIHPTAEGQRLVAETVLPYLRPLLEEGASEDGGSSSKDDPA
ncbi:MAG: arylesterase [Acidobacteriota bacterium]